MIENAALVSAILASPADDLPRMVYADWLEENGEAERAEFIRVQIELANRGPYCHQPGPAKQVCIRCIGRYHLERRERKLWRNHGRGWFGRSGGDDRFNSDHLYFVRPTAHSESTYDIRRGFVAEVRCTLADWCGGECECVGRRTHTSTGLRFTRTCSVCSGSHRTPGIGPAVVARHPVEAVRLTDVLAVPRRGTGKYEIAIPYPYTLHFDVALVAGGSFDTEPEALAALSAALIVWAKSQPAPVVTSA